MMLPLLVVRRVVRHGWMVSGALVIAIFAAGGPAVAHPPRRAKRIVVPKKVHRITRRVFGALVTSAVLGHRLAAAENASGARHLSRYLGAQGARLVERHASRHGNLLDALQRKGDHRANRESLEALRVAFQALAVADGAVRTTSMRTAVTEQVGVLIELAEHVIENTAKGTKSTVRGQSGPMRRYLVEANGRTLDINHGDRLIHIATRSKEGPLRIVRITHGAGVATSVGRNLDQQGLAERIESTPLGRAGAILRQDRTYTVKPGQSRPTNVLEERYFVSSEGRRIPQPGPVVYEAGQSAGTSLALEKQVREWNLGTNSRTTSEVPLKRRVGP